MKVKIEDTRYVAYVMGSCPETTGLSGWLVLNIWHLHKLPFAHKIGKTPCGEKKCRRLQTELPMYEIMFIRCLYDTPFLGGLWPISTAQKLNERLLNQEKDFRIIWLFPVCLEVEFRFGVF